MQNRTGGQIVLDHLRANGIDAAFCVPGESFLAVLDALYGGPIRLITCRHEAAVWTPTLAWVAPGPLVTRQTPGRPVSLP